MANFMLCEFHFNFFKISILKDIYLQHIDIKLLYSQSHSNCDNLWSYLWLLFLIEQNITENIPQNTSSWASFQGKEIVLRWNIAEKKKIYREKPEKKKLYLFLYLRKWRF